jgi:hypothetical protein
LVWFPFEIFLDGHFLRLLGDRYHNQNFLKLVLIIATVV